MKNKAEAVSSDNMSDMPEAPEVVETSELTERSGNAFENKGSDSPTKQRSRNVAGLGFNRQHARFGRLLIAESWPLTAFNESTTR
jgi:hypothetical protein